MPDAVIDVQHLTHRYPKAEFPAVDDLSFTLAHGEILGLLGPNGAGKTTTLHAVLGLLEPTAGVVRVLGLSPVADRLKVLPRLNFASVDVDLPSNLTVAESLWVFAGLYTIARPRQRIDALVEQLALKDFLTHAVGSLSSGERMRLKVARALLNEPELLILDEPTLSLDPYMAQKVRELLKQIQRQKPMAILHTSHNMQEVESFCDRIIFLHHGKKLAEGAPSEVVKRFQSSSLHELFMRVAQSGELSDVF